MRNLWQLYGAADLQSLFLIRRCVLPNLNQHGSDHARFSFSESFSHFWRLLSFHSSLEDTHKLFVKKVLVSGQSNGALPSSTVLYSFWWKYRSNKYSRAQAKRQCDFHLRSPPHIKYLTPTNFQHIIEEEWSNKTKKPMTMGALIFLTFLCDLLEHS